MLVYISKFPITYFMDKILLHILKTGLCHNGCTKTHIQKQNVTISKLVPHQHPTPEPQLRFKKLWQELTFQSLHHFNPRIPAITLSAEEVNYPSTFLLLGGFPSDNYYIFEEQGRYLVIPLIFLTAVTK